MSLEIGRKPPIGRPLRILSQLQNRYNNENRTCKAYNAASSDLEWNGWNDIDGTGNLINFTGETILKIGFISDWAGGPTLDSNTFYPLLKELPHSLLGKRYIGKLWRLQPESFVV